MRPRRSSYYLDIFLVAESYTDSALSYVQYARRSLVECQVSGAVNRPHSASITERRNPVLASAYCVKMCER